jgi:hypothetical protein
MSAHRFWRINVLNNAIGAYPSLNEVAFAATVGGANLIGAGTASAQTFQASFPAANAVDGNVATYWGGQAGLPCWWAYDFGVGVNYDIVQVTLTVATAEAAYGPTLFTLDHSDDASVWTTAQTFAAREWATSVPQVFLVTGAAGITTPVYYLTPHRYWRLSVLANGAGQYASLCEVVFAATVGGVSLFGTGAPSASSSQTVSGNLSPTAAIDGDVSTYWGSGGTLPAWWGYDFGPGVAVEVAEVRISINAGLVNYSPELFTLDYSDDTITYGTAQAYTPAAWASNLIQSFPVTTGVPAPTPTPTLFAAVASVSLIATTLTHYTPTPTATLFGAITMVLA